MTREEAIAILNNVIHKTINGETDLNEVEALDMAIEALKQEPCEDCVSRKAFYERFLELPSVTPQESFINKPCVSSEVCEHDKQKVLDKIRTEIKHFMYNVNPSSSESDYACNYILQIIDKYKAESEDT